MSAFPKIICFKDVPDLSCIFKSISMIVSRSTGPDVDKIEMSPDILQYFLDDFWNFHNFRCLWTRSGPVDPVFIIKIFQKIQEKCGSIVETYSFSCLRIRKFENFRNIGKCRYHFLTCRTFECSDFWDFEMLIF